MCGIFGAIGEYDASDVRLLAVLNEKRGTDSFGMYDGKSFFKSIESPRDNLHIPKLNEVRERKFVLGHTRNASRGSKVSKETAHPFKLGPVVGAHNGDVWNFEQLKNTALKDEIKVDIDPDKMEVDSQIIFWGLWRMGFQIFKQISGGWACAWYDHRAPEYFWLGCHTNNIAVAETDSAIYYSSDHEDLTRIGLKPVEIPDDTVIQVHIPTLKFKEIKIEAYVFSSYHSSPSYGTGSHSSYRDHYTRRHSAESKGNAVIIYPPSEAHLQPVSTPEERKLVPWTASGFQNNMKATQN